MTTSTGAALQVRRINTTFGAEVTGIDLAAPLDATQRAQLWELFVTHKVLFFPGQQLTPDSQVSFTSQFGELTSSHPVMDGLDEDHPEIWEIDSYGEIRNDVWHTDVTFVSRPPLGAVLRAVTVPDVGGDTNWADLEAAYNSLSAPIQHLIDGLTAIHDGTASFGPALARRSGKGNEWDGTNFTTLAPVEHPVVRVHPETERKSVFINPEFTTAIKGVSSAESRGILDLLFAHIAKPEHIVRHRWTAGDVAMWDNRCTAHYANFDYGDFRRVMQRVTLRGDAPFGPSPSAA